jgi:hypothetical protein
MMRYHMMAVVALATAACGGGNKDAAKADSLARDLAMAPADSTASAMNDKPATTTTTTTAKPTPRPAPTPSRLTDGTNISGASMDSLNSRTDHVGKTIRMTVASAVKDAQGRTVIPAGAIVTLRVDVLGPAENDNDKVGKLGLTPVSVAINGTSHGLSARVDSVHYVLHGRGVTAGDAAKVGAGAVVGGIAGRLIGGNKRGTAVGAVAGAAAGAAVASKTNDRDVVIRPTDYIRIVLTSAFAL